MGRPTAAGRQTSHAGSSSASDATKLLLSPSLDLHPAFTTSPLLSSRQLRPRTQLRVRLRRTPRQPRRACLLQGPQKRRTQCPTDWTALFRDTPTSLCRLPGLELFQLRLAVRPFLDREGLLLRPWSDLCFFQAQQASAGLLRTPYSSSSPDSRETSPALSQVVGRL